MKLNNIHQDLKELYKNKKELKSLFAIDFTCDQENERLVKIFKKGYWSVMPFAFEAYNNFAVRLDPRNRINESSIVQINNSDGVTVAANLKTFLILNNIKFIKNIKLINDHFLPKKAELLEASFPYREYTNGINSFEFFYEYISNPNNSQFIENAVEGYEGKIYIDFWNYYNNTPQQKAYSELILQMNSERKYYPKFKEMDYGIWKNRIYNAIAERAYIDYDGGFKRRERHVWKSLILPHGFDALSLGFGIIPDPGSDSSRSILGIIDEFDINPDLKNDFSKEVLEHPLYEAIQDLRVRKRGYMGEKHAEAAAILDTEYNDPYGAWDALVTASYWAGQAGSKAIEPMWEAAIYLSEKHNWIEIHEVLVQQYEYYNHYKDKV
ncbi:hypothetical protein ABW636_22355 [Aquimarina sp. 2201CG1-2-11]|uniref:hypothetical protein n=1 Tax=Aquimarina discodermiae TaxID=3231043 RepID=UPI00346278B5